MVDTVYDKIEDVAIDGKQSKEPCILTEDKLYATDIFRMYCFKVLPCCKLYNHNWKTCPFLHEGEKAGRRDPQKYRYVGIECQDEKKGECQRGDTCPYAHNLFEFWLHPSRYRTQLCNKPSACRRKVCFFAHSVKQLRHPSMGTSDTDGYVQQQTITVADSGQNEELPPIHEVTSLEPNSAKEQKMQPSSPQLPGGALSRCLSAPFHDRAFSSPLHVSFTSEYSASARPSPTCSPVPSRMVSDWTLKKSYSTTIAPLRDTPTPARMSPTIRAVHTPFDGQQDADLNSPFGLKMDSVLSGSTLRTTQSAFVWKVDSSSDGCLTNANSMTDEGDI